MDLTAAESSCSAEFLSFPGEIIELVLQAPILSAKDVTNVSRTCQRLHNLCQSNEVWRKKVHQRWPKLCHRYGSEKLYDWNEEYKLNYTTGQRVRQFVQGLSPKYYKLEEISNEGFQELVVLMEENDAGEVILSELLDKIHDENKWKNLTCKYYAHKVLRFVQNKLLKEKWKKHLSLPNDQQKLEEGAVLLSQWCRPKDDVSREEIIDQLDNIALKVVHELPDSMQASFRNGFTVAKGSWSTDQERVILKTLNHILYEKMKFSGNSDDHYNKSNSYIDQVLERKRGIPISLSILYVSIASRLGVECLCVNYPSHFLIKWKEHPMAPPSQQYTYIDAYNKGEFRNIENSAEMVSLNSEEFFRAIPPKDVYSRMCRNLINICRQEASNGKIINLLNILELYMLIQPEDIEMRLLYVRINIHLGVNLEEMRDSLQETELAEIPGMGLLEYLTTSIETSIQEQQEKLNKPVIPKRRNDKENKEVAYSVGMVMKHKRYHYMCVIFGWDPICKASQEWIVQMGVPNLPKKDKQPFYNVLVEDGSHRYAAQESLFTPTAEQYIEIGHEEVGKHFQEFTGRYYIMNAERAARYPDDAEVTQRVKE